MYDRRYPSTYPVNPVHVYRFYQAIHQGIPVSDVRGITYHASALPQKAKYPPLTFRRA